MTEFSRYVPISKVDVEQRMVWGYASTEALDSQGEIIRRTAISDALADYMKFANIREMHQPSAVGKAKEAIMDEKGLWVGAKVVDNDAWVKVKEGVYGGFSIGGKVVKRDPLHKNVITALELLEISLVDRPACPEAVFSVFKRATAQTEGSMTITNDQVAERARSMAKAAGSDDWTSQLEAARADLEKEAKGETTVAADQGNGDGKGKGKEENNLPDPKATEATKGADAVTDETDDRSKKIKEAGAKLAQVWQASDGATFPSKEAAAKHEAGLAPQDPLTQIASAFTAALGKITKATSTDPNETSGAADAGGAPLSDNGRPKGDPDPAVMLSPPTVAAATGTVDPKGTINNVDPNGAPESNNAGKDAIGFLTGFAKKKYTDDQRKEQAKSGEALPDGSFPIKDKADLENAIRAFGRAKDKPKAKAHIIARAKALNATSSLPPKWEGSTQEGGKFAAAVGDSIQKGFGHISRLACLIEELEWLIVSVDYEQQREGDEHSTLPALLRQDAAHLASTLRQMVDEETSEMLSGTDFGEVEMEMLEEFIEACAVDASLKQVNAVAKVLGGSRLSPIPEVAGRVVKFTQRIAKETRRTKADLEKIQTMHDHCADMGAKCTMPSTAKGAETGDLSKMAGQNEVLQKQLEASTTLLKTVLEQVQKIADQPASRPMPTTVQVIDKSVDSAMGDFEKMDPMQRVFAMIKASHSQPIGGTPNLPG